jgi:hypothetical protein
MTLRKLRADRRIKKHVPSKAELDELRGGVAVKLKDAKATSISDDTRFATAYGAGLLLAKMALACAGYRLDSKAGGHHKTAFVALAHAVGPSAKPLEDYFQVCRLKRNEIDYDRPRAPMPTRSSDRLKSSILSSRTGSASITRRSPNKCYRRRRTQTKKDNIEIALPGPYPRDASRHSHRAACCAPVGQDA